MKLSKIFKQRKDELSKYGRDMEEVLKFRAGCGVKVDENQRVMMLAETNKAGKW